MRRDILKKAIEIEKCISSIDEVSKAFERNKYVRFSTPHDGEIYIPSKLYDDLKDFLIKKKAEYEIEFDEL